MSRFIYQYNQQLLLAWTVIIFILCATPGAYIPSISWLDILNFDKWVHAAIFFILTVLFFLLAFKQKQSNVFLILYVCLGTTYGISLEIMQARWFSNRSFDPQDMLANSFGCILALALKRPLYSKFNQWSK